MAMTMPTFLFSTLPTEIENEIEENLKHRRNFNKVISKMKSIYEPDFYTTYYFNGADTEQMNWINQCFRECCDDEDIPYAPFKSFSDAWEYVHFDNENGHFGWGWCFQECINQYSYKSRSFSYEDYF